MRRLLAMALLLGLSTTVAARDIDPINMHAFLLDDHPFTIAPCDGDPMPGLYAAGEIGGRQCRQTTQPFESRQRRFAHVITDHLEPRSEQVARERATHDAESEDADPALGPLRRHV